MLQITSACRAHFRATPNFILHVAYQSYVRHRFSTLSHKEAVHNMHDDAFGLLYEHGQKAGLAHYSALIVQRCAHSLTATFPVETHSETMKRSLMYRRPPYLSLELLYFSLQHTLLHSTPYVYPFSSL